jgi:hypothetical protein
MVAVAGCGVAVAVDSVRTGAAGDPVHPVKKIRRTSREIGRGGELGEFLIA